MRPRSTRSRRSRPFPTASTNQNYAGPARREAGPASTQLSRQRTSTSPRNGVYMSESPPPVVEMREISVDFPGVKALDRVSFRMFPGEVHSLMGENGAGKSTLIKALTGVYNVGHGEILLGGVPTAIGSPARSAGGGDQHRLPGGQPAAQPVGRREHHARPRTSPVRSRRLEGDAYARDRSCSRRLHLDIDPDVAAQRALARRSGSSSPSCAPPSSSRRVLILDEPTSSLDADEVVELFRVIKALKADGVAILFVSHFLDQVYQIAERLTVLRNGKLVGEYMTEEILRIELVHKMIGKDIAVLDDLESRTQRGRLGRLTNPRRCRTSRRSASARKGSIAPVDLKIHEGEIVGLAGLLGSGRTELARLLAGADRADTWRAAGRGQPDSSAQPTGRPQAQDRLLVGGPQARGSRRRPDGSRQHRARLAGRPRLAAPHPAPAPGRARPRATSRRSTSDRPTRRPSSATSAEAISRRFCWRGGWRWHRDS